jgi:hypothetical protein
MQADFFAARRPYQEPLMLHDLGQVRSDVQCRLCGALHSTCAPTKYNAVTFLFQYIVLRTNEIYFHSHHLSVLILQVPEQSDGNMLVIYERPIKHENNEKLTWRGYQ